MVAEQKIQVKQNAVLVISASTLIAVIGSVFWLGREMERADARLRASVTVTEMALWEQKTQRLNSEWRGAGIMEIRAKTEEDKQ